MSMRANVALLVVFAAVAAAGCHRKPEFIPPGADSLAVSGVDSTAIRLRHAQENWESGASEEAASDVALALADRLSTQPPRRWMEETESLLDSLGIGAESAFDDSVLAINFFSRSDPLSGSWPYLYWWTERGPLRQAVEGKGLHLLHVAARDSGGGGGHGLAALFGSRGAGGQQPLLMVWSRPFEGKEWKLTQTLGPDSLGGVGTGEFEAPSDTTELVTRTFRKPRFFEECATCPHVYRLHRFRWREPGFERIDMRVVPSPYSTFVQFIQAIMAGDRDAAASLATTPALVDRALSEGWDASRGAWRIAPAMDETPGRMVFFRGEKEAYSVQFAARDQTWLVAGFEAVSRNLE